MQIKADSTAEAARMILAFDPPLEIEIPRQANVSQFIRGAHYYLYRANVSALISDASTTNRQYIYVYEKGKTNDNPILA